MNLHFGPRIPSPPSPATNLLSSTTLQSTFLPMAYQQENQPGTSSSAHSSDLGSPHSPEAAAAMRLRFLVSTPNDSIAVSRTLVDLLKDVQQTRRSQERDPYVLSIDQLDDLLLLAQHMARLTAQSGLASIESTLSELTSKVSDIQHVVRGSSRSWSRLEPIASTNGDRYAPLVPLSDTPPPTAYGRDRQPVGFVSSDGRVYSLMEDQRRVWSYSGGPTWPRDYDHPRANANGPGELPPWYPIGRRTSRADETLPQSGDQLGSRTEQGSSVTSAYDNLPPRPHTGNGAGRRSPISVAARPIDKPRSHHIGASGSATNLTPSSTAAITDASSKAPSISFLVNPSYETMPSRIVSRDSRSPPPRDHPIHRPDPRYENHHGLDLEMHHRATMDMEAPSSFPHSVKLTKAARSDITAPGKRRIRNGACTFCREKKLACRPGPMADDPNATGPPTCDQCYRRQRTCQHDPEHRRRRRTALPTKKPGALSDDGKSSAQAPVDVDAEDGTIRMESEDPSMPVDSPERGAPKEPEPVKDEEVDQLETEWMQPD